MPNQLRDKIEQKVLALVDNARQEYRSNADGLFCDAYCWQVLAKIAEDEGKKANAALLEAGLVDEDDDIRALGQGEHTVESSNNFSMQAKVSAPGNRFDKDTFISKAARRFRIETEKLVKLAETSTKESKAALSKWIIEL